MEQWAEKWGRGGKQGTATLHAYAFLFALHRPCLSCHCHVLGV